MKITVVGRQMTVRDSLKEMAAEKLKKLDRFFGDEALAYVTFGYKRNLEIIEITISYNGTTFRSEEGSSSFQNALDAAMDALTRQIRRNKTRLEKRIREGAFGEAEENEEEEKADILRVKTFPYTPMSPEEAILQMNLTEHQFYMFNDAETDKPCVVYKRHDGGYGLLIPETT